MKRNNFSWLSAAALTLGLLAGLLVPPGAWAQMHGGSSMGGQQPGGQPGMNQQGAPPNGTEPNAMGMQNPQNSAQAGFVANVKRNSKVETDLSKMALKNSSNDGVKQFAQQVIQENRKNEMSMTGMVNNNDPSAMSFAAPIPEPTHKAEKQMKKMTGTPFDQMYLAQMDGYVKNDQKLAENASANMNSGDMGSLAMQMRNTADARTKQIAQLAQGENFKIQ